MPRFQVNDEVSHACCHEALVVDTTKCQVEGHDWPLRICECFDTETAHKIAALLNRAAMEEP